MEKDSFSEDTVEVRWGAESTVKRRVAVAVARSALASRSRSLCLLMASGTAPTRAQALRV